MTEPADSTRDNRATTALAPVPDWRESGLASVADDWQFDGRGAAFADAMRTFIEAQESPNTRRTYAFGILEFWDWYEREHGACPTPDRITRSVAAQYVEWLKTRSESSDLVRLRRQQGGELSVALCKAARWKPGMSLDELRQKLNRDEFDGLSDVSDDELDQLLGELVRRRYLRREPTVAAVRNGAVEVDADDQGRAQIDFRVASDVFRYYPAKLSDARGDARASTIATRLGALSSLWEYLSDSGENIGQTEPLLQHNIWRRHLRRASRLAPGRKKASRARKTPSLELYTRVLATTYERSHGAGKAAGALQAARAALAGEDTSLTATGQATAFDLRNRVLMLLLLFTGMRADEVGSIRRRDLADSGLLTVVGKGGKTRMFRVPDEVLGPLAEFDKRLTSLSRRRHRGATTVNRYQRLLEMDAPLVPALKLWGRNQGQHQGAGEMRGLSRSGIAMTLRRSAKQAGIEAGSADLARIHPHGIRHLAGKWAQARGIPLPIIQAVMGHGSLSTTGQYVEEHDPTLLCLAPAAQGRQEAPGGAVFEGAPIILDAPAEAGPPTQPSATLGIEPTADTEPNPPEPESAK
jgi:integrase